MEGKSVCVQFVFYFIVFVPGASLHRSNSIDNLRNRFKTHQNVFREVGVSQGITCVQVGQRFREALVAQGKSCPRGRTSSERSLFLFYLRCAGDIACYENR